LINDKFKSSYTYWFWDPNWRHSSFFFFFWWYGAWTRATPPALLVLGIFKIDSQTICPGWLQTAILLISASWVARIRGISHQRPAQLFLLAIGQTQEGKLNHRSIFQGPAYIMESVNISLAKASYVVEFKVKGVGTCTYLMEMGGESRYFWTVI
jgi:hypothetical protein